MDLDLTRLDELILDPTRRAIEPRAGQLGYTRMFVQPGSIDEANRTIRFNCSTMEIDRYGELIEPAAFGACLPAFLANPVFMAGHVHIAPDGNPTTIGTWSDLDITDTGLDGTARFMDGDDLAERYWQRYSRGVQRAVSVGFLTHSWTMREVEIDGHVRRVRVFDQVELIEISAVAIPACRSAVAKTMAAFGGLHLATPTTDQSDPTSGGGVDPLEKRIERILAKLLHAGPGGLMCSLFQDVVAAQHGYEGYGVELDDDPEPGDEPDPDSASTGNHELTHALRDALGPGAGAEPADVAT